MFLHNINVWHRFFVVWQPDTCCFVDFTMWSCLSYGRLVATIGNASIAVQARDRAYGTHTACGDWTRMDSKPLVAKPLQLGTF